MEISGIQTQPYRSQFQLKCPHCAKLYSVETKTITETRPRFHCKHCQNYFWTSFPECLTVGGEVMGIASNPEPPKPRPIISGPSAPYASLEVLKLWEEVLKKYEDRGLHVFFVTRAVAARSSEYAAHVYGQILKANPGEEIALEMRDEITRQLEQKLQASRSQALRVRRRPFPFIYLVYFCCAALVTVGWLVPELRNLAGLGAAMLFITVALRFSFRTAL